MLRIRRRSSTPRHGLCFLDVKRFVASALLFLVPPFLSKVDLIFHVAVYLFAIGFHNSVSSVPLRVLFRLEAVLVKYGAACECSLYLQHAIAISFVTITLGVALRSSLPSLPPPPPPSRKPTTQSTWLLPLVTSQPHGGGISDTSTTRESARFCGCKGKKGSGGSWTKQMVAWVKKIVCKGP